MQSITTSPTSIIKRDGRTVDFDPERIRFALLRCYASIGREADTVAADDITARVVRVLASRPTIPTVEQVQDLVEQALIGADDPEAAKHYILYRAERARARAERPIPDEVREAFAESAAYFPTPIQQFQFFDKYSRFNYELGRRETWVETVDRAVGFLFDLAGTRLDSTVYERVRRGILEMRAMPSMRLLAMAGPAAHRNHVSIYNCFGGETPIVTMQGVKTLKELAGRRDVWVRAINGEWRLARVRSYGRQQLQRVTFGHWNGGKAGNAKSTVRATPNHTWHLLDGTTTTALRVGDKLAAPELRYHESDMPNEAVQHGFIYGDGTVNRQGERAYTQVRLCGTKAELLNTVFAGARHSFPPSQNGDPMVYLGPDTGMKALPDYEQSSDPRYIAGFIHGLSLADGSRISSGNVRIDTQDGELVDWLKEHAPLAGWKMVSHRVYNTPTNFGPRSNPLHQLLMGSGAGAVYRVEAIEPDAVEEVYCVEEPHTHTFQLANGQITGNCSYQPVESIDSFVEALLISMAGCGVGYSVERKYVERLPRIERQRGYAAPVHRVEDSAEGWGTALRFGLASWFSGCDVTYDFSDVRPAGAPLRTKGGRASGPEPLRQMLAFVRGRILARQGSVLRPIDAHDLMCAVGNAAVSGGMRRTAMISLFDQDDQEMRLSKSGDFERENAQRWNANNSVVWTGELTQMELIRQFEEMYAAERGEPGIFSRLASNAMRPERRQAAEFGTNPCGEINLRPWEFCNLTAAVARAGDTPEALADKVEVATIIGTIQSLATYFPGLRPQWARNCEEERLLGVDVNGQMDCAAAQDPRVQGMLRERAVALNRELAGVLGINQSAAVTCVKPSGNSSQLLNCSSGLHARWAPYYIRNVRVSVHSPIYKVLRDAGVPMDPENGQTAENASTYVVHFPMKSPEGSITRNGRSALEQLNYWLQVRQQYTEHNPSATITYRPDELVDVLAWVSKHQELIGGLSFLPSFDAQYAQMPYVEIGREEYERLAAAFPPIDFSKIWRYEESDLTSAAQEIACASGACEVEPVPQG